MHIISLFLPLLIHSGCSIPTAFQPLLHDKEITPAPALITRGTGDDDHVSDWTFQDKVWGSNDIPPAAPAAPAAAKGVFLGVTNPAPSTEYVDFLIPASPSDAPTPPEQEQQQQQQQPQPGKLQKGENGCPTTFPSAVCDPGEGVTSITKAALPGFLNLDKCRQSMLLSLSFIILSL